MRGDGMGAVRGAIMSAMLGAMIVAAPAWAQECRSQRTRVVGGEVAALRDWPGVAALRHHSDAGRVSKYFCGGAVVHRRWVLTAGHCMHNFSGGPQRRLRDRGGAAHDGSLQVVLGVGDLREVGADNVFGVEDIVIHPNYALGIEGAERLGDHQEVREALDWLPSRSGDDVALLKLDRDWTGPLAALSLDRDTDPLDGDPVRVAGFGVLEGGGRQDWHRNQSDDSDVLAGSPVLLETAVETISHPLCRDRYSGSLVGDGQLCAGLERGGRDSCQGDSGGPLVALRDGCAVQVGLVSWGAGCAERRAYGVYTRVSAHADWIQQHTGPLDAAERESEQDRRLDSGEAETAERHLISLLGQPNLRLSIRIEGANELRLGDEVAFIAESDLAGQLLILDVNAEGQVTQIFPNEHMTRDQIVAPGDIVRIPEFGAGFRAVEPVGRGKLIAILAPEGFSLPEFEVPGGAKTKGFEPIAQPGGALMRFIRRVEEVVLQSFETLGEVLEQLSRSAPAPGWALATLDYTIRR